MDIAFNKLHHYSINVRRSCNLEQIIRDKFSPKIKFFMNVAKEGRN